MYFISISVTLFIIIAAVHLLAKVRNENLGIFSKLIAWLVLLTALLMLVCQLYRGVHKMEKRGDKCKKECKMDGDHHMMIKKKMHHGGKGNCSMHMEDECTCPKGEDGKCKDGGNCKMECCNDSAAHEHGKGMHKEVEVIIEEK